MPHKKTDIQAAAEYICLNLHPRELRAGYVEDIRVCYQAEPIVYLLQALSAGMTSLLVGLITNYLYDKTKEPDQKLVDLEILLNKQEEKLVKLELMIATQKQVDVEAHVNKELELHRQTVERVQGKDPMLTAVIEETLKVLEQRGQQALADEVESHLRRL